MRRSDQIADDLLGRIVSGELPPGSLLPREAELAAQYGVQRGVIREAVKQLEVHRLVRPVRRRGTVVLDPQQSLSPEVLRAMLAPRGGRVDARMLACLLEVRNELDVQMLTLAARRRTRADLQRLDACAEAVAAAVGAPRRFSDALDDLVLAVAEATHNPIFVMLFHWHRHILREREDLFMLVRVPNDENARGARALVEAIRARDAETLERMSRSFHAWATPVLLDAVGGAPRRARPEREGRT